MGVGVAAMTDEAVGVGARAGVGAGVAAMTSGAVGVGARASVGVGVATMTSGAVGVGAAEQAASEARVAAAIIPRQSAARIRNP